MGKEDTPVKVDPQAEPTPTPPAQPTPAPDPAEELRRENEQLKKQNADKDRFITDLNSEKATLEARLTQTQPKQEKQQLDTDLQKEASRILETAQVDPQKAGEDLAALISATTSKAQQNILQNLEPIINQNAYVSKVKEDNKDLMELGLEPSISLRATKLMQSGKSFKEAVDTAVSEAREKVDKLKSNTPKEPTPPPPGAVGEKGANVTPTPTPPPKEETEQDEIAAAKERRRKLGL